MADEFQKFERDAPLRARVRAAIIAHGAPDTLTDAVLAAIPEPAPVVRSHKCSTGGVTITYKVGAEEPWVSSSYRQSSPQLRHVLPLNITDDDLAACLALRNGPDAKDAQIAALNIECLERAGTALALTEQIVALTKRLGVERDAVTFWREQCDVRERGLKTVEAELAALKAKAGTPVGYANIYSDGSADFSQNLEGFEPPTSVIVPCRIAVPLYEAPPTPAEHPVIGYAVIRSSGSVVQGWWLNGKDEMAREHSAKAVELAEERGAIAYQVLRGEVVP